MARTRASVYGGAVMRARPSLLTFGLALGVAACAPHATDHPGGLASTSLCADGYLLAVAPERIAALSWQAGSPLSTAPGALLARPRLWDNREVLHGRTDGLVTGPGGRIAGDVALEWGEDFDAVRRNARAVAALGGSAEALLGELDALENLPKPPRKPRILYLSRSGGSAGPGTYVDAVITKAGGTNIAATPGWHTPSVEALLGLNPDIVLTSFFGSDYVGANDRAVRHAALRRFIAARPRIDVPGKLWPCAGPGLADATRRVNRGILAWAETA